MRFAFALTLVLLPLAVCTAAGLSFPIVERVAALNARSLAMGGTSVTSPLLSDALSCNPGLLARCGEGLSLEATSGFRRLNQVDTKEVFDSFDNTVGEATLGTNVNGYYRPLWGGVSWRAPLREGYGVIAALGVFPEYDFGYGHRREYRDESYILVKTVESEAVGVLHDFAGALALSYGTRAAAGVGYHYLKGSPRMTRRLTFEDPTITDTISSWTSELAGGGVAAGAYLRTGFRLLWGAFYRGSTSLSGDFESSVGGVASPAVNREITVPSSFGLGVSYIPSNEIPSLFSLEVIWRNWSEYDDNLVDSLNLHDVVEYRLGVEHEMIDRLLVRAGFAYLPWQMSKDISQAQVSLGVGYDPGPLKVDIGAELGKRTYKNTLLGETAEPLTVDETHLNILLTLSRSF
jgi:hypothetical protein